MNYSIKKIVMNIGIILVVFFGREMVVYAVEPPLYFNNAINTDPTELGNYWNDQALTDPASQLPDFSTTEVFIVSGATFNGDAVFNATATNEGTVTGNATFNGDFSENNGTVLGNKIRRYFETTATIRDFTTGGSWIVIADGIEVDIGGALFNEHTSFSIQNNGTFAPSNIVSLLSLYYAQNEKIFLLYTQDLNTSSIPSPDDYTVTVNGVNVEVVSVDIVGKRVLVTLDTPVDTEDIVSIDYTPASNPVASLAGAGVSSIDDLSLLFQIPVGTTPFYPVAIGTKLYIPNNSSNTVSVIDTVNNTILANISLGASPKFTTSIGNKVYLANNPGNTISVIDTTTDTVAQTVSVGTNPSYPLIVGTKLYVFNTGSNTVSVIDTVTDTVVATVTVGSTPNFSSSVGTKLYVLNSGGNTVSVIDTVTDTVVATVTVGNGPFYSSVVANKVYINSTNVETVSVIDSTTDTVVATFPVGNFPYLLSAVGSKVYVNNVNSDNVTSVNAITDTVLSTISVGSGPIASVSIGTKLFVNNSGSSSVSVVDTLTDTVTDTISVGSVPEFSVVIGNKIYVSNQISNTISIINTTTIPSQLPNLTHFTTAAADATYTRTQTIPITAHFGRTLQAGSTMTLKMNSGGSVTLNQVAGSTLSGTYTVGTNDQSPDLAVESITSANVSDTNGHTRTAYDLPASVGSFTGENSFITRNLGDATNIAIGIAAETIDTGDNPYQISGNINGSIYVANQGDNSVSVINATTGDLTDTISVGGEPYGLAYTTGKLYVANILTNDVSVIDTATNTVIDTIDVGIKPYYVATVGTKVYVTNGASNTVSVIDATTDTLIDTIPVGSYPRGIKAHGTDLYVANYGDPNYSGGNYISVIDSVTDAVTDTIITPAGSDGPRGVNVLGDKVYVANFRSNDVSVIDTNTNTVTDTIDVGTGPRGIAGTGTTLYVENFDDGTISVIDTNTNSVTDTIVVGSAPSGITIIGTTAYITSFQDNTIYKLNTATNELNTVAVDEVDPPAEESRTSSGSSPTRVPTPPAPTDCLPGYTFSPATGIRCPMTTTIPSPYTFTRTLKLGMSGPDVQKLQQYLNTHGFPVSPTGAGSPGLETTLFGPKTKASVMKFQVAKGLKGDGIVGPMTRGLLK